MSQLADLRSKVQLPIYMDNHATTRCDPRVLQVMLPYFSEHYGNAASRTHVFGRTAEEAVDKARAQLAKAIGASADREIVFTSGATESDNLAIKGVAHMYRDKGDHLITVATEHKAVLDAHHALEREGFRVTFLAVGADGLISLDDLRAAITDQTILVSVMCVNNEVGTVQPLEGVRDIISDRGPLLHVDASQAPGKVALKPVAQLADLLTLSGHKAYGPKGAAALVVRTRRQVRLHPLLTGGGQEDGLWPGTVNVPAVVGLAQALDLCENELSDDVERIGSLSAALLDAAVNAFPGATRNGSADSIVPHCLSVTFEGVAGETLVAHLAREGIAAALGSACSSEAASPSHVLAAMGLQPARSRRTLRFGLGRFTTPVEIDFTAAVLQKFAAKLRR